jgi:hypothetical protein
LGKFRALETDLERLKEKIEAENEAKAEIQKAMSRALAEAQIWKSKYTTEACARIEDLENARAKLMVQDISLNLYINLPEPVGRFFPPYDHILATITHKFGMNILFWVRHGR